MSGPIVVRAAVPDEFDAIARLTVDAYRADGQLETETGYEPVLADVAGRAAAGEVLVAIDSAGAVLGAVLFVLAGTRYADLSGPGETEFRMLAVDPAAQGRGVGQTLVQACLDRAREFGASALVIYVRDFSHRAQRLYARNGFVRTPERDWTPVPGVNLYAMRLSLDQA